MRFAIGLVIAALSFAVLSSEAMAEDALKLELNKVESVKGHCRMSYLIENKADVALDSFKLDLVILGTDNTMQRRMVIDIAPVRAAKTIFRVYEIEPDCEKIGSVLVNDVQACAPGEVSACLDRLALSSRVPAIRLYK